MKKFLLCILLLVLPLPAYGSPAEPAPVAAEIPFRPDTAYLADRQALDRLQRDAFRYIWEDGCPVSGMAYESVGAGDFTPVTTGGTGFGIAAIVVATDRGWITREQALARLQTITAFLRDKTARKQYHGAFPHWIDGKTGATIPFGKNDTGADIVETALLMQGLLIARAYFNGPGVEETLRSVITELWEGIDWDWFTNGENSGLYWHWNPDTGFSHGLRILGYNEGFIAYILALSSPTNPVSSSAYDYWTSDKSYQPKELYGYTVAASLPGGGPLFVSQYPFIGLDPRRMADPFVPGGYFTRNVKHTLSNRGYCLYNAPSRNRYSPALWGLTASQIKGGYAANEPSRDSGTIAPTAALSSMPYTPHYSMQVLENLDGPLRENVWGKNGPYDAFSLRDNWFSNSYLAIDQLTMVGMVENYRSGLLWNLLMQDKDVRIGLQVAGITDPQLEEGFPEAVVTLVRKGKGYVADAYDIRRHPDTGLFMIPYWAEDEGEVRFTFHAAGGDEIRSVTETAAKGRNVLTFPQFMPPDGAVLTLTMHKNGKTYSLPVRLH
ncbi:conserved exported hypothetical protein [uncultured delta proteobacterium]|uniref:Glycoamylase-like domain-containing protein n=1 Tax=uncultured delta proteobacterium TaxID=34034 RepID=A0A212J8E1_9DELT|nr:conserved exported hypothetical protein [uncultured delta proteobacterium]